MKKILAIFFVTSIMLFANYKKSIETDTKLESLGYYCYDEEDYNSHI